MFRTSIVHLQERSYVVCCNLVCLHTSCCEGTTGSIETYQIATYSIRTLLKMDYWSTKHVELLNVRSKINHQIFCISLDYIYIAKWYTVHTISNYWQVLGVVIFEDWVSILSLRKRNFDHLAFKSCFDYLRFALSLLNPPTLNLKSALQDLSNWQRL